MSEFRARIGRVRMKAGGADVHILDRKPINTDGEDWRGSIMSSARQIASYASEEKPLLGYVVVGIFNDGTSVGWRYDFDRAPMPRMLLPSWIAEVIRRDLITETEAREVFHEMFQWVDN